MVKTVKDGFSLAPFLSKCYEMVDDHSTDKLISWSPTDDSFVILDDTKFSAELLPKYFKHSNFSSFVRQLNIYGFRKTDTDRWEFANEGFIKGQKHLMRNIIRRKQPPGMLQRKSSQPQETDGNAREQNRNVNLWKEVERLKTDKNSLMQELVKLGQHQKTSESKLVRLREQLKGMEKNQQQMLSFIVMAMQNPGILVQFLQPKESSWFLTEASKSTLKQVTGDCKSVPSERMLVTYEPSSDDTRESMQMPPSNPEDSMGLDFFSDEVKDLFTNSDFMAEPLDHKLLSSEIHTPFVIPDLPDGDGMLEQLLLTSPMLEDNGDMELFEDSEEDGMNLDWVSDGEQLKDTSNFNSITNGPENFKNGTSPATDQQDDDQIELHSLGPDGATDC